MISLYTLSHLSARALTPVSLTAASLAAAWGVMWSTRSLPQIANLSMDAINPGPAPAEIDLPTPHDALSIRELERLFRLLSQPENQVVVYRRFAEQAGIELTPQEMWLLQRLAVIVGATEDDLAIALRVEPERLAKPLGSLQAAMLVTSGPDSLCLTDDGRAILAKMTGARHEKLSELFSEWAPGGHYEIQRMIDRFTKALSAQMPPEA